MDRRFLYYFFRMLRSTRFLLPKSVKRYLPRQLIAFALMVLFLWYVYDKLHVGDFIQRWIYSLTH